MPVSSDARKDVVQQKDQSYFHHHKKSSPRYTIPLSARYNDIPGCSPAVEREIKGVPNAALYQDKTKMEIYGRLSLMGGSQVTLGGATRARTLNGEEGRPKGPDGKPCSTFGADKQFTLFLKSKGTPAGKKHKVREPKFHDHPRNQYPGPCEYATYSSFVPHPKDKKKEEVDMGIGLNFIQRPATKTISRMTT